MNLFDETPPDLPIMRSGVPLLPSTLTLASWAGGVAAVVLFATVIMGACVHRNAIAPWLRRPRNLLRLAGATAAAAVWIRFLTDTITPVLHSVLFPVSHSVFTDESHWPTVIAEIIVLSTAGIVYLLLYVSRERPIACFPGASMTAGMLVRDPSADIAAITDALPSAAPLLVQEVAAQALSELRSSTTTPPTHIPSPTPKEISE